MGASQNPRGARRSRPRRPRKAPAHESTLSAVSFGPEICCDLAAAEQREWLVTNGIGGFASGTVAGSATRRYHGLLIAALQPPIGRTFLVGGLDETAVVDGCKFDLATHHWASGAVSPQGFSLIADFRLDGSIPVWTYAIGSAQIEKRIWMRHGENTTFVQYTLLNSPSPIELELKALVNYRDFHGATHAGDWRMCIELIERGTCIKAFAEATPFYILTDNASCEPQHIWYRDFFYSRESERGLDDREDQLHAATFRSCLRAAGDSTTIVCSIEAGNNLDGKAGLERERKREKKILKAASVLLQNPTTLDAAQWLPQLVLAADQFVVDRELAAQRTGKTLIAGYHWFSDWGRDTMIAQPGLVLATGRTDVGKQILLAFASFVDNGMLPNTFPDSGVSLEFNTMDATLWYFESIRNYFSATTDLATLRKVFPVLAKIISCHVKGTRYNIHVDPSDGLLYGGGPGVQLTWMDAKIGDWVVTPRTGKPVEINALWIRALENMAHFADVLKVSGATYEQMLSKARSSFQKFWNAERSCCFDVIDAPGIGKDGSLRPNQIFAVALGSRLLSPDQEKAVVDICADQLLTPFGLRSLAPTEPGYRGSYSGGPRERDAIYHQGLVWGWLLAPFALAHYRVYKARAAALALLEPLASSIGIYGLGTLAEIFDGDAPHQPRGCIAQAWTVGGVLRVVRELQE